MDKLYSRINWQNQPSTHTALGATNLNRIDVALNSLDDRAIKINLEKLDKATGNEMVKDVVLNPSTGVLSITKLDGTVSTWDLDIEKVVTNFDLNEQNQLVLTLADGAEKTIDLDKFIDIYNFDDTETIAFSNENKNITAQLKRASITSDYLQPDYLSNITVQALSAQGSAMEATERALIAQRYSVGGVIEGDITDNAKYYKEQAQYYAALAETVTDIGIATEDKAGMVKSGGDITILPNGEITVVNSFALSEQIITMGYGKADKEHIHNFAEIKDVPTTLPADGGNADTVSNLSLEVVEVLPETLNPDTIYFVLE